MWLLPLRVFSLKKINGNLQCGSSSTVPDQKLEFKSVDFCGGKKTGEPGEKTLGARMRTNNKLTPHMTLGPGIEPGPHWW